MRLKRIAFFLSIVLIISSCKSFFEPKESKKGFIEFSYKELEKNTNTLIGQWEFYPFKVYNLADLEKLSDTQKNYIYIPSSHKKLNTAKGSLDTGYATYRLKIKLPQKGLYAIKYAFLYTSCNVYLNDKLIFRQGNFSTKFEENSPKYAFGYFPVVVDSLSADSTISLIFHFSDYSSSKKFGITKPLIFGKFTNIESKYNLTLWLLYFVFGILGIMIIYNIFIFIFYPRNISILYFSLMTLAIGVRSFVTSSIFLPPFEFSPTLRISFLSAGFFVLFTLLFYRSFFKNFISKSLLHATLVYSALLFIFYIFSPIYYLDSSIYFLYFFIFSLNTYFLIKLFHLSLKREQNALPIFLAQLIFYVSMLNDMLFYLRIVDWGYIAHYTISLFVAIESIVIARNLSHIYKTNLILYNELDYQNKNLEYLVRQRTKEIEEKNKELMKLSLIAEKSHNVIIIFDQNFDLVWANTQFENFYNLKFNEAYKKINLLKDSTNKKIKKIVEKVLSGQSVTYTTKCYRPKRRRWAQTTLSPLIIDNQVKEIIAIESDITKIKKIERKLIEQNIAIRDSLRYATTIQSSILPTNINKYFKNFIIYKPKEIVSGDFYFFKRIENLQNDIYITGIADCTGHGVPGAFMSLIISQLIDQVVDIQQIYEPAQILNNVNKMLKDFLNKNNSNINSTDGAAAVVLKIQKNGENTFSIDYSTANLSFFIYHKKQKRLNHYKTNVSHIGWYFNNESNFEQQNVKLFKSDIVYVFSDGYYDQLNPHRKRFGKKNFYDIIMLVNELSIETQQIILEDNFQKWKKNQEQYDDILLYAIEIG